MTRSDALALVARALRPLFDRRQARPIPRRIVVLKPCCIGDVLLSTAALGALRRAFPQAHLAFAVGAWSRAAIEGNPDCDEIVDCGPVAAGADYTLADYWRLVRQLRAGRYDLAVVLERSALFALLPLLAGIPWRAGLDSEWRGCTLTHPVPIQYPQHEAELYLDAVRTLGVDTSNARLRYVPSPRDRAWAAAALARFDRPPVALHPGGAANPGMVLAAKRWPPERYAAVAADLLQQGRDVVLVGGPGDRDGSAQVRAVLGDQAGAVLDLTGKTTIGRLGAVLARCELYVGGDTGPMHLAVAVGTRAVAIFGPSTPEMYGPFDPASRAVYRPVECSPCFLRGTWNSACPDYRCIKNVHPADVLKAIQEVAPSEPA